MSSKCQAVKLKESRAKSENRSVDDSGSAKRSQVKKMLQEERTNYRVMRVELLYCYDYYVTVNDRRVEVGRQFANSYSVS